MAEALSLDDYTKFRDSNYAKSRDKEDDEEDTVVTPSLPTKPSRQRDVGAVSLSVYTAQRDGTKASDVLVVEDAEEPDWLTPVAYDSSEVEEQPDYEYVEDRRYEKVAEEVKDFEDYVSGLKEEERIAFDADMRKDMLAGADMREAGLGEYLISQLPTGALIWLGNSMQKVGAMSTDVLESTFSGLNEAYPEAFEVLDSAITGNRYGNTESPKKLADFVAEGLGSAFEFTETIPALGSVQRVINSAVNAGVRNPTKVLAGMDADLERANRYNVGGARIATSRAREESRKAADAVVQQNRDIADELILAFEDKTGKTISKKDGDNLTLDLDAAREAGRETAIEVTERDGALFDLAIGPDNITSPILNPDKFNGIVAIAVELKKKNPEAFNNKKTIIDNLFELTVNKDLDGQGLVDGLNKYGLSFEDYVLTVVGSGSDAGKVLNKLSQIARTKPTSVADDAAQKLLLDQQGTIRKGVMRIENIRRGLLVSQVATAARNLTSGGIRAPLEGLANVMDSALYEFSQPMGNGTGGFLGAGKKLASPENWKDSFRHMKYMFDRPDVAKAYTDLVLEQPQLESQFNRMFNNLNEIQALTGRGEGGAADKVLSGLEDVTDFLNVPNRWQEYLIRRGTFFGELERLTRREYKIDLIDALQDGKLKDLLNDASSVKPEGARSFINIVDDSVTKALDITYAKQPDIPVFRSTSQFITRNGLTVIMPFPRFMFNSMELMGQYAAGASIPLTRKVTELVTLGKVGSGPLTAKDRQRISRNLTGMAAVGAAYMYRTSDDAPAEFNQVSVSEESQADTMPLYPVPQYMYLGEATKRMQDGTFNDWFDAKEFVETFAGTNLRTGTSNALLEEVSAFADATDLTKGESMGRLAGRTLGNYLGTWAVPLAQIIEAQRVAGVRGLTYADAAKDPTLDFMGTFKRELIRPIAQRGILTTPEEEAALPERQFLFAEGGTKQRGSPIAKFGLGLNLSDKDSEAGEYLTNLGFKDYKLGSTSKVPSIKRFENKMLGDLVPTVVEAMKGLEDYWRRDYAKQPDSFKAKVKEEKYVNTNIKPEIQKQFSAIKSAIREGSISQGDAYTRAIVQYRNVSPELRKIATLEFYKMYPDREINVLNTEHINTLIAIAEARK